MSVDNTAPQDDTNLGVRDDEQLKECQGMYVLVAEKDNLDEVVSEVAQETSNAAQKCPTPLHKSVKSERGSKKDAKKNFLMKWAQQQNEKVQLQIDFMKEEHKLKMEKLKLEIKQLSDN